MRTEQLQHFLKVAQTGSMRIAANELFISQPALSSSIKQLENELGYALFKRSHSGVILTEDGKRALPIISKAISELMALPRIHLDDPEGHTVSAQLKVLTVHSQNLAAIPALLKYFRFHWPNITFYIFEKSSSEVLDGLLYEDYDLGLISLHSRQLADLNLPEDVILEQFDIEPAYVRVHKTSILASEKSVTLQQLATFPLVFPNSSPYDEFTISKFFNDIPPQNIVLQTNNTALIEAYCSENDCALPCYLFMSKPEEYLEDRYKFIPITDTFTCFYALYHKSNPRHSILETFIQALKNHYNFSPETDPTFY